MTETQLPPMPRLWTEAGFRDDEWSRVDDPEELGGNGRYIVPLPVFLAIDGARRASLSGRIGVELLPGEALEEIVPHLDGLALVALAFPAFNDGRSFSKAELLRRRHAYEGIIRATGDVVIDLVPHMLRTGFSELLVSNPVALARLGAGRTGGLPLHYQPAARPAEPGAGYSWRRRPVA